MEIADSKTNLGGIKSDGIFWESFARLEYFIEFAAADEWHYEVETSRRLEEIVHADEKRMVARKKDVFLQLSVLNLLKIQQNVFTDRLYCVLLS